ncbi:MAG TPA: metallophosphoesterase [Chloroflexi bacterium]|nr:metallophosphoesterase [Chloroflexota bacterium]
MKIGIISDTHDNLPMVQTAVTAIQAEGITHLFHCGDVCGPMVLEALTGFELWIAQGNMDRHSILSGAAVEILGRNPLAWIHKPMLDGYRIAVLHGENEEALSNLIASGAYTYVFHGHTHRRRDQVFGRTRVINPGALGGTRRQSRSFCILDLSTGEVRFIELSG